MSFRIYFGIPRKGLYNRERHSELDSECHSEPAEELSFAQAMSKHMSVLIVKGFENSDGKFIKLSSDSEEQAMYIVQ